MGLVVVRSSCEMVPSRMSTLQPWAGTFRRASDTLRPCAQHEPPRSKPDDELQFLINHSTGVVNWAAIRIGGDTTQSPAVAASIYKVIECLSILRHLSGYTDAMSFFGTYAFRTTCGWLVVTINVSFVLTSSVYASSRSSNDVLVYQACPSKIGLMLAIGAADSAEL
jgi:hypothetical protein